MIPPHSDSEAERSSDPAWKAYAAFWATGVGVVGGAIVLWWLVTSLVTVLSLIVISLFFTIVLTPAVDVVEARLHLRRGLATLGVFLLGVVVVAALTYAFAKPIYDASDRFTRDLPGTIRDAERGRGEIGRQLRDLGVQRWAHDNLPKLRRSLTSANGPLVETGKTVATGVVALVTVLILTFLMLMQAPSFTRWVLGLFPEARADRIRRVATDAGRAVSGYMAGNVVISLIAGLAAYAWLRALGVPFAFVLALWVAFADLLPLVGATLGAIPSIFVALLQSPGLGIATLIFFIVYQQLENHLLQTTIMAKTVKLNPLGVLLAVLVGVELAGLLGALLAIPFAGAAQVVLRDIWKQRRGGVADVLGTGIESDGRDAPDSTMG